MKYRIVGVKEFQGSLRKKKQASKRQSLRTKSEREAKSKTTQKQIRKRIYTAAALIEIRHNISVQQPKIGQIFIVKSDSLNTYVVEQLTPLTATSTKISL